MEKTIIKVWDEYSRAWGCRKQPGCVLGQYYNMDGEEKWKMNATFSIFKLIFKAIHLIYFFFTCFGWQLQQSSKYTLIIKIFNWIFKSIDTTLCKDFIYCRDIGNSIIGCFGLKTALSRHYNIFWNTYWRFWNTRVNLELWVWEKVENENARIVAFRTFIKPKRQCIELNQFFK